MITASNEEKITLRKNDLKGKSNVTLTLARVDVFDLWKLEAIYRTSNYIGFNSSWWKGSRSEINNRLHRMMGKFVISGYLVSEYQIS